MKNITTILKEKDVNVETLPENIQSAIENSISLFEDIQTMEEAITDESTDEEKDELQELKITHEDFNESILGAIDNFFEQEEKQKKVAKDKNEPTPAPAPTPPSTTKPIDEPKKKGIGFGTFIIGAAVLIATAGAVNMMRNKN